MYQKKTREKNIMQQKKLEQTIMNEKLQNTSISHNFLDKGNEPGYNVHHDSHLSINSFLTFFGIFFSSNFIKSLIANI